MRCINSGAQRTHAVAEKEVRNIGELLFHNLRENVHIVNKSYVAVFLRKEAEFAFIVNRFAVTEMVVAADYERIRRKETGKLVISLNMLRHTVSELNYAYGRKLIVFPDKSSDFMLAVRRIEICFGFYNSHNLPPNLLIIIYQVIILYIVKFVISFSKSIKEIFNLFTLLTNYLKNTGYQP